MSVFLTRHADYRIWDRQFSPDDICAALAGREIRKEDGSVLFYDNHSRVTIAVAWDGAATTCYRMLRKTLKARYSR